MALRFCADAGRRIVLLSVAFILAFAFGSTLPLNAQSAPMVTVYAVTVDNTLLTFNANAPQTIVNTVSISGLPADENLLGIDVRPATGQVFSVSSGNRLYIIDPATGTASPAGAAFAATLNGSSFGFDFNPTVDRIRLTSNDQQDLRLNPINGALAATDGTLTYAPADTNAGVTPYIVASAYTNNFNGATTTTLFNIDASLDVLVTQNPPNNGTLNTIGSLGIDAAENTGFDILSDAVGTDTAFAAIGSSLYTVNLATGSATLIGSIGGNSAVYAIAVTGSVTPAAMTPMCSDFNGSTSPIVHAVFSDAGVFCRVLYENGQANSGSAASQIGSQAVLNNGVIQAVDIFTANGSASLSSPVQVCLLGEGNINYLDATQSPRTPQLLGTTLSNGYTCANIPNTGMVVLVNN